MSFVTPQFLVFFVCVLGAVLLIDRFGTRRMREIFLLCASYFFYGHWDRRFCFLLLFVTVSAYLTALQCRKKAAYRLGVVIPLAVLGVFKYLNFFLDTAGAVFGKELGTLAIILPVGISFYTFQALSYVVDVKRGKIPVERDFIRLALYISFFPQLVAGPIVRASDFLPQLHQDRKISRDSILLGIQIILLGVIKKNILADRLALFVDDVFRVPSAFSGTTLLWGLLSCSLQVYLDFSGYSDIAIGCAYCLGYVFKKNFNLPYLAESFTEFWNRWHISMSGWFTEYVFYPLASAASKRRLQLGAIFVTMFLSGLWHGAEWTKVLWGCLLGIMLMAEKVWRIRPARSVPARLLRVLSVFSLNALLLVFFRASDFQTALVYLKGIFTMQSGIRHPYVWTAVALLLCLGGYAVSIARSKAKKLTAAEGFYPFFNLQTVGGLFLFFVTCGLMIVFAHTKASPFVYFQF